MAVGIVMICQARVHITIAVTSHVWLLNGFGSFKIVSILDAMYRVKVSTAKTLKTVIIIFQSLKSFHYIPEGTTFIPEFMRCQIWIFILTNDSVYSETNVVTLCNQLAICSS